MKHRSRAAIAAAAIALLAGPASAGSLTLSYSGTIFDDGVRGAAYFDNVAMPAATAFSFQAVFDPGSGFALGVGQAGFVASQVRFTVAGYGSFTVVPGSYIVTMQDPTGAGLFGDFVNTYAFGLDELTDPGPGALLAGFATATPNFTISAPGSTVFGGDQGLLAEMYTPFTSGDELDFYIPTPVPGDARASIPEPATLSLLGSGIAGLFAARRRRTD
jgi:hypothetical protein